MKTIMTNFLTNPLILLLNTTIAGTLILYRNELLNESVKWIVPVIFVIIVDLIWGIRAAKYRKERITFTSALRRSVTKVVAYSCWIILSVGMSISYGIDAIAAVMMSIVLVNEIISCINNYLQPSGKKLNIKSVLAVIGEKLNLKTLKDVSVEDIKKEDKNGQKSN